MILRSFCFFIGLVLSVAGFQSVWADTIRIDRQGKLSQVILAGTKGGVSEEFYRLFESSFQFRKLGVEQHFDIIRNDSYLGLKEYYFGIGFFASFTQYEDNSKSDSSIKSTQEKEIPRYLPPGLLQSLNQNYQLEFSCSQGDWKIDQTMDNKGVIHTQLFFAGELANQLYSYMENLHTLMKSPQGWNSEAYGSWNSEIHFEPRNKKYRTPNSLIQCEIKHYGLFRECRLTIQ